MGRTPTCRRRRASALAGRGTAQVARGGGPAGGHSPTGLPDRHRSPARRSDAVRTPPRGGFTGGPGRSGRGTGRVRGGPCAVARRTAHRPRVGSRAAKPRRAARGGGRGPPRGGIVARPIRRAGGPDLPACRGVSAARAPARPADAGSARRGPYGRGFGGVRRLPPVNGGGAGNR